MQSKMLNAVIKTAMFAGVLLVASVSSAADVYLQAKSFQKQLPDGMGGTIPVTMWGFVSCDSGFTTCDADDSPGPQINLTAGDDLNIELHNTLSIPVSIMIPGQPGGGAPTFMSDGQSQQRVQSLTNETAPGGTETYTWTNVRAGTFLYQSGTHQPLQVPMGLYGALVVRPATAGLDYAQTVIGDGAAHYYRLGADFAVDEVTSSAGTAGLNVMSGSLGYSTDGAAGFDGTTDAYVDTGVTDMSDSVFSVEAWVNANDTAGQHRIAAKDKIGTPGAWVLWFNGNALRFQVRNATDTAWIIAEAPTTPAAGTTFHVVGVFDGTDAILYVDGAEVARTPLGTSASNTNELPVTIGASSVDAGTPRGHVFDGTIDEVAIYETALTATQIQAHFVANSFEPVLLLSEIDPTQNARVDSAATVATPTTACVSLAQYEDSMGTIVGYPCAIDYNPFVLLVNGETTPNLPAGAPGNSVLLRLLNAGLRSHTPAIVGLEMALVAEDGNAYPGLPRRQSMALLPAGKTLDAILGVDDGFGNLVMPGSNASFALFDREPTFSNEALPNGGGLVNLQVGTGSPPSPPPPSIIDLAYPVIEDTITVIDPPGGPGIQVVTGTSNGVLEFHVPASGQFTYTPNQDYSGVDSFVYRRNNGLTYHVTLNVSFVNDTPVAMADGPFVNAIGTTISVAAPGILGNDADADGDSLTAVIDGATPAGLELSLDGSFTYTGADTTFSYVASDGTASSAPVTVTLNSNPVSNIALTVKEPGVGGAPVTDYRWTVEEDAMWQPDPSVVPAPLDTLATNFHKSYMPVIAQGTGATEFAQLALDPNKHYYVSVLPADAHTGAGHTIGGSRISPADQAAQAVTVEVNPQPLPSAQISIFVFEDSSPTNGAVDGAEQGQGLGGFQITLEDAGGRYGISAGTMSQDAFGEPLQNALDCFGGTPPPMGIILTCPDTPDNVAAGVVGEVLIKNLFPGKYGIIASPAAGDTGTWTQTSTIEGTKVIDAWVKAGEPRFFQEFGPGTWHVFVGFVNPTNLTMPSGGSNVVSGNITNAHISRPPLQTIANSGSYDALAHTRAWVGLNSAGGNGANVAAVQAEADGSFTIPNVPDGLYQLVVWDSYLDQVIAFRGVSLPGGGDVGDMPVFQWFTRTEHNVFLDDGCGGDFPNLAQNGVRDECSEGVFEAPIAEQAVNLRWRDGTVNQSFPTDLEGFVPFDQTFPFFHWQVLEVDFARFKATGLTTVVDAGGEITSPDYPGVLEPQEQESAPGVPNGEFSRTETGAVLTQGFQGFLGQTSIFDWGKAPYKPGENGGISGIVYYPSTRAENDPRLAVGEPWEPGIPGVTVRLYREVATELGGTALALLQETTTDDWDNSLPTGCPGADPSDLAITGGPIDKCYDGLRNFNQARPAVFDGGYAFMGQVDANGDPVLDTDGNQKPLPPGKYVVEVVPPPGYDLLKEEDNNVGYGDSYDMAPVPVALPVAGAMALAVPDPAMVLAAMAAEPGLAQPPCVGPTRMVPDYLSLFPNAMEPAPFAGADRPLCNRKEVILSDQGQAAADFFLLTGAPIAGHFAGVVLDDVAQEFDVNSPQFGEKWAPPYTPISLRDFQGNEISRFYADQWGRMNGLVPSTFTANMPSPSGFSPAMHQACMNDPGPILDTDATSPTFNQLIQDPQYNPGYSNFCYTFQYMPGTTTYLDTPVLPVSAFASGYNPPDCAPDNATPMISRVGWSNANNNPGPWAPLRGAGETTTTRTIDIRSMGNNVEVPNPAYEGPLSPGLRGRKTITRNFGFGGNQGSGTVMVEGYTGGPVTCPSCLEIVSWNNGRIRARIEALTPVTGELVVTRGNGNRTINAVTVTISDDTPIRVAAGGSIQDAIDSATPGSLILVEPGTYDELVIMWKPVRLQGAGAGTTFINAAKRPTEKIVAWRELMDQRFDAGKTLPTQPTGAGGFTTEEGAAITVVGVSDPALADSFLNSPSRIDGFSITGGDVGGGIFVNGWAHNLEVANNKVFGNGGLYAGGIRVGRPFLQLTEEGPFGFNTDVNIHNNAITQNGGLGGAGGGLSIATGTDNYSVSENFVCGNFTTGDGGGIGHLGLSDGGMIADNEIVFNQSFLQGTTRSGGGLFIAGEPPVVDGLTHGSGNVTVDSNLVQGNQAGAGHGGGIRSQFVNGRDIVNATNNGGNSPPGQWYRLTLNNNMIVNNVAGWSGGGVSMQDTARSFVVNNTIAHNDSTATVSATFTTGDPNVSANQPAGIATEPHSPELSAVIPIRNNTVNYRDFSNPVLRNNILWQNRSFHYDTAALVPALSQSTAGECAGPANYLDLGVLGGGFALDPRRSVLTDATGYPGNTSADPGLVDAYCNGGRTLVGAPGEMLALPAVDEGGAAWIDVRYGPLTRTWPRSSTPWDYHIDATSSAVDFGRPGDAPSSDYDGDSRPLGANFDAGADELVP